MESLGEWERKNLISELLQGMDLTRQLQLHLSSSSSHEIRQILASRIVASYENALSMLNWSRSVVEEDAGMSELPPSLVRSPQQSGDSDKEQETRDATKKRKTIPRWTKQVLVSPSRLGLEGHLDDGYNWRKYGQKDILGAKYSRGYYKCTNRNNQGCLATKQVQRSNDDPNVYEITYRARHTCNQPANNRDQTIALAMDPFQINEHHPFNFISEPFPNHVQPTDHSSGLLENIIGSFPSLCMPSVDPGSSFECGNGQNNVGKSNSDHLSEIFSTIGTSSPRDDSGFA